MSEFVRGRSEGPESLTMMLISKIAAQEDVDPVRLTPPLNSIVDVDALEKLVVDDTDGSVKVEFTYSGHRVTIEGEEDVHIGVE